MGSRSGPVVGRGAGTRARAWRPGGRRLAAVLTLSCLALAPACGGSGGDEAQFRSWLRDEHGLSARQAECLSAYVDKWWGAGTAGRIRSKGMSVLGGDDRSRFASALVACTVEVPRRATGP